MCHCTGSSRNNKTEWDRQLKKLKLVKEAKQTESPKISLLSLRVTEAYSQVQGQLYINVISKDFHINVHMGLPRSSANPLAETIEQTSPQIDGF